MFSDNELNNYEVIYVDQQHSDSKRNLKLLISFNKIEFSSQTGEYHKVAKNIFMSTLPFLLYVKKVTTNPLIKEFETVKEKAKLALLKQIEDLKRNLLLQKENSGNDVIEEEESIGPKITLLNRAILVLEKL